MCQQINLHMNKSESRSWKYKELSKMKEFSINKVVVVLSGGISNSRVIKNCVRLFEMEKKHF